MNLNNSNLSHPRMQWSLEAAMWRAAEFSRANGIGISSVQSAGGKHVVGVLHDRKAIPAFSFWRQGKNVTPQIVKALREHAAMNQELSK